MRRYFFATLALVAGAIVGIVVMAAEPAVPYPKGYRTWNHVKSMVILPGHPLENPFAGVHHVYANKKALAGLQFGKYEDGAVFVFDLLEGSVKDNAVQEGPRKLIGVMHRDVKKFAATGGWGYEGFAADSTDKRLVGDGGKSCHACHESSKDRAYVFSALRK